MTRKQKVQELQKYNQDMRAYFVKKTKWLLNKYPQSTTGYSDFNKEYQYESELIEYEAYQNTRAERGFYD